MPWRAIVAVAEISETAGLHREIDAGEGERQRIAATAGLRELPRLAASFDLVHAGGSLVRVSGRVRAQVEQTCVVTLEPLTSDFDEAIDVMFAPEAREATAAKDDGDEDPLGEDPPEPIVNGEIDLGALATEFLLLGLDPYPRKPGVVFEPVVEPVDPADHPFAALAALKGADSPAKPEKPGSKGKSKSKFKGK
jgi:uncharacterized metal-binding protein YceD (DUF177 family)